VVPPSVPVDHDIFDLISTIPTIEIIIPSFRGEWPATTSSGGWPLRPPSRNPVDLGIFGFVISLLLFSRISFLPLLPLFSKGSKAVFLWQKILEARVKNAIINFKSFLQNKAER
jgi:hypothetical protein